MSGVTLQPSIRIATLGAAFSANKGAAAMLHALITNLPKLVGPCSFDVLTTYPTDDRTSAPHRGIEIVPSRPLELLLVSLPLALLAGCLRLLRLPHGLVCRTRAMAALHRADLVVDLAGISFADGRSVLTLAYNVLMTGVPLLLGKRVVKCSQALGPFRGRLNRVAAKLVLPHVSVICARGRHTAANLADLGLTRVIEAADLAFLMEDSPSAAERAAELTGPVGAAYLAAAPSAVARRYCASVGIDYVAVWSGLVAELMARGDRVVLITHSFRPTSRESRMNDGPVCRDIHAVLGSPKECLVLDRSEPPDVWRAVIRNASLLVTSRFHAMISAFATETPVVVAGWSHKYAEVMNEAGLQDFVLSYDQLSTARLLERCEAAQAAAPRLRAAMRGALPTQVNSARRNLDAIRSVLADTRL